MVVNEQGDFLPFLSFFLSFFLCLYLYVCCISDSFLPGSRTRPSRTWPEGISSCCLSANAARGSGKGSHFFLSLFSLVFRFSVLVDLGSSAGGAVPVRVAGGERRETGSKPQWRRLRGVSLHRELALGATLPTVPTCRALGLH